MSVRQWGPNCYSAYVDDGSRWGRFVGVCETREAAETLATQAMQRRFEPLSEVECRRPDGTLATPAEPDRTNLTQQGERL